MKKKISRNPSARPVHSAATALFLATVILPPLATAMRHGTVLSRFSPALNETAATQVNNKVLIFIFLSHIKLNL